MELQAKPDAAAAFPKPIESSDLPPVEEKPAEAPAASAAASAGDDKPELRSTKD